MSLQTARDVSLRVLSPAAAGERRISPSWTLAQLKTKLEPVTGIPPLSQKLLLKVPGKQDVELQAADEDAVQVGSWGLSSAAEIEVLDTRPPGQQNTFSLTDPANSAVPKYEMPVSTYSALPDSVLAWKKAHKLGRFDPSAPEIEASKAAALWDAVEERGIAVGKRCQLGEDSSRRGVVAFVGEVPELPGVKAGAWVGVRLDEPVGRNEGFVGEGSARRKVFDCGGLKCGVFVRPERVVVGEFPVLEVGVDEDMEEI